MKTKKILNNTTYQGLAGLSLASVLVNANIDTDLNFKFEPSLSGYEDFVFFGSARSLIELAVNKIIDTYPINYSATTTSTSNSLDYENANRYYYSYSQFERRVLDGFTHSITGTYLNEPFTIKNIPRNSFKRLVDINDLSYVDTLRIESELYDDQNRNMLKEFVPTAILENDSNGYMESAMNMFGHIFDEINLYTTQFGNIFNISYDKYNTSRPIDKKYLLALFGYKAHTSFLFNGLLNFLIGTDVRYSEKAIQIDIWNRVLNNLTYIYKTKGTVECLKAFMNVLGLNWDMIDFSEYVDYTSAKFVEQLKYTDYYQLKISSDTTNYIKSTSSEFSLNIPEFTVICNFNIGHTPKNHYVFGRDGQYFVKINNTSTVDSYGNDVPSGIVDFSYYGEDTILYTVSTTASDKIFYTAPKTLIITKTTANVFSIEYSYIDLNYDLQIEKASAVFVVPMQPLASSIFYLGKGGIDSTDKFVGNFINFKLFDVCLDANAINNYRYVIDSINISRGSFGIFNLLVNWELNEPLSNEYRTNNNGNGNIVRTIYNGLSSVLNTVVGEAMFDNSNAYERCEYIYPVTRYMSGRTERMDKINIGSPNYKNSKNIGLTVSLNKYINEKFEYILGPIDFYDYFVNSDFTSDSSKYSELEALKHLFYDINPENYDYNTLIDSVEKYAIGLFSSFKQLLPASAVLLYNGLVVESPVFDRNKNIIRNAIAEKQVRRVAPPTISTEIITDIVLHNESKVDYSDIANADVANSLAQDIYDPVILNANITNQLFPDDIENIYSSTGSRMCPNFANVDLPEFDIVDSLKVIGTHSGYSDDINVNWISNNHELYIDNTDNKIVSSNYTVLDKTFIPIIYGNAVIALTGSSSAVNETRLIIKYQDMRGDVIIGSKMTLIQNSDNADSIFEIIDENGVSSVEKSNSYYFLNYSGVSLTFKYAINPAYGNDFMAQNILRINNTDTIFKIRVMRSDVSLTGDTRLGGMYAN